MDGADPVQHLVAKPLNVPEHMCLVEYQVVLLEPARELSLLLFLRKEVAWATITSNHDGPGCKISSISHSFLDRTISKCGGRIVTRPDR